jgi:hypothetical protein
MPNPSLKPSANGVSRWRSSARPAANFSPAAQRATPLAPAWLERQASQGKIMVFHCRIEYYKYTSLRLCNKTRQQ